MAAEVVASRSGAKRPRHLKRIGMFRFSTKRLPGRKLISPNRAYPGLPERSAAAWRSAKQQGVEAACPFAAGFDALAAT